MLIRFVLVGAVVSLAAGAASAQGVYHQGYLRNDGTYVQPYSQSAPDRSYNNNWSTSPNVNPHTGQMGTRMPTYNDRPPSGYNR